MRLLHCLHNTGGPSKAKTDAAMSAYILLMKPVSANTQSTLMFFSFLKWNALAWLRQ